MAITVDNERWNELMVMEDTLVEVRQWAIGRRYMLDNFGPCITSADGEFMCVGMFEDLEVILE